MEKWLGWVTTVVMGHDPSPPTTLCVKVARGPADTPIELEEVAPPPLIAMAVNHPGCLDAQLNYG
ncbi:hypothetical protein FH972_026942 [Carpinus fangiana]|uniref:Uncharacterized protein n=1 Tax=Carpinus fangiana TaxID=176857 RepID=A0A5N6L7Z9_9ROSI|nr:hypothetical protein FH972_026942 [Carpinus fangiana]